MTNAPEPRSTRIALKTRLQGTAAPRAGEISHESKTKNSPDTTPAARLSIIIPARNEEHTIGATLNRLRTVNVWEVIVVDGDSTDRTVEIARSFGATVVRSFPGRGRQMNVGAAAASGGVLLFLHADTTLPLGFHRHVSRILAHPNVSAGAFQLNINAPGRSFRVVEKMVLYRSRFMQYPYGDQALFMKADTFHRVGGFPDWSVMEDIELVRRLRRIGLIEIAPVPVVTSARRWLDCGTLRTTLYNQACVAAYWLGISPKRISRWRDRTAPARTEDKLDVPVADDIEW